MHTTSIRDFKKEKVLGTGSFGSVYLVRRRQDNKIYALKTVNFEKLNKKEQENSLNEIRILSSVNHPNVIGYKEAFWDDDKSSLNLVMEFADDGDLHSKIEKMKKEGGLFNESIIWSYAIQMIEGLKALHDKKIIHRDLKSSNIFLVKDKHQCKIGDMKASKVIKEKALTTQTGSPYYASPEVWKNNPYSYKSDLWSIGCIIYELCALRPPFQGKDLDELYENVCKGQPERINKIYSDDLWKMILMLLQVDVNKRVDCNQFLNSDLIKRKIEQIKKEPNIYIESFIYDKNKDRYDEYLLKTIKFNDIKEIKAQLPTKKNNNRILSDNVNKHKLNDQNNEELLSKKLKAKQLQLEKMENYLNKNNKSNIDKKIKFKHFIINDNIEINIEKAIEENKNIMNKLPIFKCNVCNKRLSGDLNEQYINCDKCNGNICDECNKTHLKEFPTHRLQLIKYITIFDTDYLKYINNGNNKMNELKEKNIEKSKTNNFESEEINKKINQLENEVRILNNKLIEKEKEIQLLKSNEKDYNNKIQQYINEIQKLRNDNNLINNSIPNNDSKDKIISLMEELQFKENEIKQLKAKFPFELNEGEKLMVIIFSSIEEDIYYPIICKNTDKFNAIEYMLYDAHPQYLERENYFTIRGEKINKSKTIEKNNIKYGDIIILNN